MFYCQTKSTTTNLSYKTTKDNIMNTRLQYGFMDEVMRERQREANFVAMLVYTIQNQLDSSAISLTLFQHWNVYSKELFLPEVFVFGQVCFWQNAECILLFKIGEPLFYFTFFFQSKQKNIHLFPFRNSKLHQYSLYVLRAGEKNNNNNANNS